MNKLKVTYKDISPEAKDLSTAVSDNKQEFVHMEALKQDNLDIKRYNSLEDNYWALNDDVLIMPNDPENYIMGFVSKSMSNESGEFESPVSIIRTFSDNVSSVGVTIQFNQYDSNYCSDLNIKWYNADNELLDDVDFTPDNYIYFCQNNVEYFNRMVITFKKTNNPYRYLRIAQIDDGVIRVFKDNEIRNLKIVEEMNPISEEVSINEMTLNIDSKENIDFMFQRKQRMQVDFNNELIGIFFVKGATQTSQRQHTIELEDYLGILDKTYFYGGIYNNVTVEDLVNSIITNEDFEIDIEDSIKTKTLSGYIPICTKREALQQIAFATCSVIDTSRSEVIKMYQLKNDDELIQINCDNVFLGANYKIDDIITLVRLAEHEYIQSEEISEVYKGFISNEDTTLLEFEDPHYDYNITGGTIIESSYNYCIIIGNENEEVILNAKNYTHLVNIKNKSNPKVNVVTLPNEVTYENATLISSSNSNEVLENISNYLFKKEKIDIQVELKNDEGVGDRISLPTEYKGTKNARIERVDIELANKFIGKVVATIE